MAPHEQRVVDERAELAARAAKLTGFFHTDTYKALDVAEKRRLQRQMGLMAMYADVLDERIEAFGGEPFRG